MSTQSTPVHVFISYSRADADLLEGLRKQFTAIERSGLVDTWYDGEIEAGSQWGQVTKSALHRAEVILLLISADFIASDHCYEKEMQQALALHERGEAVVIPVILRDCTWQFTPFAKLKCLPQNGIPVTDDHWKSPDRALKQIVDEVAAICMRIKKGKCPIDHGAELSAKMKIPDKTAAVPVAQETKMDKQSSIPVQWLAMGGGVLLLGLLVFMLIRGFGNDDPPKKQEGVLLENKETKAKPTIDVVDKELETKKEPEPAAEETLNRGTRTGESVNPPTTSNNIRTAAEKLKERRLWSQIERSNSIADFQKYLEAYPNGSYVRNAELMIKKLKLAAAADQSSSIKNSKSFADPRDGQKYRIMNVGGVVWMVDDLRYQPDGRDSWCYDNKLGNCDKIGRLYDFKTAQKICPPSWRLPTDKDWYTLASKFGGAAKQELTQEGRKAYALMLEGGRSGFDAHLGGYYDGKFKRFKGMREVGRYWSATTSGPDEGWFYEFRSKDKTLKREHHYQAHGMACRCVLNE